MENQNVSNNLNSIKICISDEFSQHSFHIVLNENGGTVHGEYKSFGIIAYKPRHNILHIYFTSWDPIFWGKESFDGLPVSWECTKKIKYIEQWTSNVENLGIGIFNLISCNDYITITLYSAMVMTSLHRGKMVQGRNVVRMLLNRRTSSQKDRYWPSVCT